VADDVEHGSQRPGRQPGEGTVEYERLGSGDVEAVARWLAAEPWPFHSEPVVGLDAARRRLLEDPLDAPGAAAWWLLVAGRRLGLLRVHDLDDPTALFDLRITGVARGRGLGTLAVRWLSSQVFATYPHIARVEAVTRRDNGAMRRVLGRCGYVKEAHYRDGWPGPDDEVHDAVGYALLRRDWATGTRTPVPWDDEPR